MKFKKILILLPLLLCCGWTSSYNLKYRSNYFTEKIQFDFEESVYDIINNLDSESDGETFEYKMVYKDVLATPDMAYKRRITNGGKTIKFSATYRLRQFESNIQLTDCFENHEYTETSDGFIIKLGGEYMCEGYEFTTFNFSTGLLDKAESNADVVDGKTHTWNIKEKDNDIYISITKTNDIFEALVYLSIFVGVVLVIVGIIVLKNKRNNR
jgi:hypothetical protein